MTMIPYGMQDISDEDVEAVVAVLKSPFLTQGPVVPAFEAALAAYTGAKYGVAVNSATSALHIACLALGLKAGDVLWTSPVTFVASANCALYCGAGVDFVDIDPLTFNMSVDALQFKLEQAKAQGTLPKVLVCVHLCGQSCDMQAIHQLSLTYGFKIIEDASHAVGAQYLNQPVGNCRFSDITVFSFHPVKIITSAEGGMAMTNDPQLARSMELLRSHGITRDPAAMTQASEGPWYYEQVELGFNYRMTELQAALGLSQMNRLDAYVAKRHALVKSYDEQLAALALSTPWQHPDGYSSFHLYVVRLTEGRRRQVFEALRARGVGVNVHYIPVHTQPYYQTMGFALGDFPQAERFYAEAISLPLYPGLSKADQDHVISSLREALQQ
jgi:UDP-4-amino-4,6-dideoxy-N-acetyl-beta-L-altrosamine transaminase